MKRNCLIGIVCTSVVGLLTLLSYLTAWMYFTAPRLADGTRAAWVPFNFTWLPFTPTAGIDLGVLIDPISVMMTVVVCTVSLMVHIYSFGYMEGERGFGRYYAFLLLFTLSMLGLVVATNLFQMYLFWELVGVSSYLLIGFYYTRPAAVAAAKKAFIVTRFADLFFLIGILMFQVVSSQVEYNPTDYLTTGYLTTALFLMFIGGAGKSAMFPLHIWLPDAMEGPTPVSALIHAATMVVAGVYLVARLFPLYIAYAPEVLHLIAYVGAFTSLYAATVACVQTDIKRVLAFSTISQIGFMMVSLGCSGYGAAMFHLFTHAFFKALLFLCAGNVIHAVHSNEMSVMGGRDLRRLLPVTHAAFLIACLAISGIPPLSGFFSKDEILTACFRFSPALGWLMTLIAGMTAFYMCRLYWGIWRKSLSPLTPSPLGRGSDNSNLSPLPNGEGQGERLPLIILATITLFAGFIPRITILSPPFGGIEGGWTEVAVVSVAFSLVGIAAATYIYKGKEQPIAAALARRYRGLYEAARHRFYIDEAYQFVTHRIIFGCLCRPIAWWDRHVIDGSFRFLAWSADTAGDEIRPLQSGRVQQYALVFLIGTLLLLLLLLLL